jgi:site-specific DNA-cytosine methylase
MRLRAIDVCSGAGGWACAARGLPIDIEIAVDLWQPACRTYALNHPKTDVWCRDLLDQAVREDLRSRAEGVDLVLGGIPCEWLSVYRNKGLGNDVDESERDNQRALLDGVLGLVLPGGAWRTSSV